MSVDWKLKLKAFLYQPPWGALCEQEPSDGDRQIIKDLLGDEDFTAAKQANEIAFGLDVPPFVRQQKNLWNVWLSDPVLRHPLSAKPRDNSLAEYLPENQRGELCMAAKKAIEKALQQVKKKYLSNSPTDDDYRKAFLALWRLLPDLIRQEEQKQSGPNLGPLWDLLPADPRVPDHSIWDHASMASAVASTWSNGEGKFKPAFFIFTIASVQDFVSTARRTQDLWMSSFLLSYLTWRAMQEIANTYGPDCIISPSLWGHPLVDLWLKKEGVLKQGDIDRLYGDQEQFAEGLKVASFPNIFTAILPAGEADKKAEEAQRALKQAFKDIAESVKAHVGKAIDSDSKLQDKINKQLTDPALQNLRDHLKQKLRSLKSQWDSLWQRQIEDFLQTEIFWIVSPWSADTSAACQQYEGLFNPETSKQSAYTQFRKLLDSVPPNQQNIGMAYQLLSNIAGRLLTARKNLRQFQQVCEPEHKCSLCGLREALHPPWQSKEESEHARELREFWELLGKVSGQNRDGRELKLVGRIRKGDRLCAICLTKRLAWEAYFVKEFGLDYKRHHVLFPSTSSVATAKFKQRVLEVFLDADRSLEDKRALYSVMKRYVAAMKAFLRPDDEAYDLLYYSAALPKLWKLQKEVMRAWRAINVSENEAREVFEGFLGLDGEWLYEESFDPAKIVRESPIAREDLDRHEPQRGAALSALDRLLTIAREYQCGKPSKYYALIRMDGDRMSDWVAGRIPQEAVNKLQRRNPLQEVLRVRDILHPAAVQELEKNAAIKDLLEPPRPLGPSIHLGISAALRDFALKVVSKVIEEEHCGKVIYAGGDDLMAFAPVEDTLGLLQKLRAYFSKDFEQLNGTLCRLMGNLATTSAGVVIAHYTHPFSHAVEESWNALKEHAKEKLKRDAFAVHLIKRSGEPLKTGISWYWYPVEDQVAPILQDLKKLVELLQQGDLADHLVYGVQEEALALQALEDPQGKERRLEWLVRRHAKESKRQEATDCAIRLLKGLHETSAWIRDENLKDWRLLADLLRLARFIAQEA